MAATQENEALVDPITFPSFDDLTDEYNPSMDVFVEAGGIMKPGRHWCFVAEIVRVMAPMLRTRTFVKTRFDEESSVAWYLDEPLKLDLQPGSTICILYAERKTFLDGSTGIRQETQGPCIVFKCPFEQLRREATSLLRDYDATPDNKICFTCGKPAKSVCTRCKLARYCSVECQKTGWKVHKHLCPVENKLLGLALLPRINGYDRPYAASTLHEVADLVKLQAEDFSE